jgi:hypothetical protein
MFFLSPYMVLLRVFVFETYGSAIDVNQSTIDACQFNKQLDSRSITKWTNVRAEIWNVVFHDLKRARYQLSCQPLTIYELFKISNDTDFNWNLWKIECCKDLSIGLDWGQIISHQIYV